MKLAKRGKLVAVHGYFFDRNTGQEYISDTELPVHVIGADSPARSDSYNVQELDFQSGVGRAWQRDDGKVVLYVHSNRSHTFKIA